MEIYSYSGSTLDKRVRRKKKYEDAEKLGQQIETQATLYYKTLIA
jgi:hypothetical protein